MARYIDAEKIMTNALKEKRFVVQMEDLLKSEEVVVRTVYKDLANFIDSQPTADVKEVKHGYWEDLYKGKYDNPLYTCSECYCRALRKVEADCLGHEIIRQELSTYCPHCGAKMDGGKAE